MGPFDPAHPERKPAAAPCWSEVFGDALVQTARVDVRICALTAAMRDGTGLAAFARAFPGRFFDVGICEEHLVAFAAGLAKAGMRPVVAIYSSFLQRAVDQVMHDVCLLKLPVILAVGRAGCVGRDGRTHHGLFDISMLRGLPNLTICQPADADDLRRLLALALETGGPWVIRYPRGTAPAGGDRGEGTFAVGTARPLCGEGAKVQLWALGDQVPKALEVRRLLAERGIARDAPRQHIAVGDDAAEPAAVVRDGQDADAVVRQQLNSMAERRLRRNGDDIGIHKCADKHGFQTSGIKLAVHSDSMAQKRALDAKIPRIF